MTHCKDCIYWNRFEDGKTHLGYCQIDPPVILQSLENKKGAFPIMEKNGWCGAGQPVIIPTECRHGNTAGFCGQCELGVD